MGAARLEALYRQGPSGRGSQPAVAPSPRVSVIMPTADRRRSLQLALGCALRQDFRDLEIVVVDDGADAVRDAMPKDARVRYLRLDRRATVGHKRNLACEAARGSILVHFDDDDWSSPTRVSRQVDALDRSGLEVCGMAEVLYHEPASGRSWRYVYPGGSRPWVAGNSLCYTKASWARAPFADVSVGEDARFIWGVPARRPFVMPDASLLVAMVHGGNVDAKRLGHPCFRPLPTEEIRSVMGGDFDEWRTLELGRGRLSG